MDSVAPKRWFDERAGRWIAEHEWPSKATAPRTLHLHDSGLSETPSPSTRTISSPNHCGVMGGEYFPFAFGDELRSLMVS